MWCLCFLWGGSAKGIPGFKGITGFFKERFCGVVKSKMLCSGTKAKKCTGPNCCQKSSCYSNYIPFAKCKGSRGPSRCGGGKFPTNEGQCECKYGSCTADGRCPATLVSGP